MLADLASIRAALAAQANPKDVPALQRFFKTRPGEYAEGDVFLGVRVPATRQVLRQCGVLSTRSLLALLRSPLHEERLLALLAMVRDFRGGNDASRRALHRIYLDHTAHINNWDLVDVSADSIVGGWLASRSRRPLYRLARSTSLWERRIAIMATFHFIKHGEADETLRLAACLLDDPHDLIHKAVGWMLREVGKRVSREAEIAFLEAHAARMPRTMLRYAIERFPETERRRFLAAPR